LSEKCIDFKYKIINNAFFLTKIAPVWQVELMLGYEFVFLRLAFEGLYLWNKKCLGPLACGFVGKLRFLIGLEGNFGSLSEPWLRLSEYP
jgi:hypothetical protein